MFSFQGFCPDCDYIQATGQQIGRVDLKFNPDRSIRLSTLLTYPDNISGSWERNDIIFTPLSDEFFDPEVQ
jgi:hypothetical protein